MLNNKGIKKDRKVLSEADTKMAEAFKALSDVNRYQISRILAQQPRLTFGNIAKNKIYSLTNYLYKK